MYIYVYTNKNPYTILTFPATIQRLLKSTSVFKFATNILLTDVRNPLPNQQIEITTKRKLIRKQLNHLSQWHLGMCWEPDLKIEKRKIEKIKKQKTSHTQKKV